MLWSSVLHAAFYFYTSYALVRYMFRDHIVTPDELYATGATFTVLAWAFAYTFMAVQVIWPGSFSAAETPLLPRSWFELLFLSFTNLTSVGLSDIVPVLPNARSVVMIEQVVGLMYVAIVISRVVGLTVARQRLTFQDTPEPDLSRPRPPDRPATARSAARRLADLARPARARRGAGRRRRSATEPWSTNRSPGMPIDPDRRRRGRPDR